LHVVGLGLVLLAAAGVLWMNWHRHGALAKEGQLRRQSVAQGPYVRVSKVELAPAARAITVPGEVRAFQQATLYAKVSGYVTSIRVDKGDAVKRDQVLATVESPDVDHQVHAAEAELALRRQNEKRAQALVGPHVISDQELDQAITAVKTAEAALARAKAMREYESIRAPFSGVVTARYVDLGALLPAATGSTQSAQPVLDIADIDRLRIYVHLGQDVAPFVKEGDPAKITFDARPGETMEAKVTRITRALDPRTRTMLSEIDVDNPDHRLYPGAFVQVALSMAASPTPLVPAEALISQSDGLFVATVRDKKVHMVKVQTGIDDGKKVQVLTGLKGDEWVALNLSSSVADGAAIQPVEPQPK
jgi:RND family efflux transporter MFP subunit